MRHLTWIVTIPVALIAISFAVSNREVVALALWPLPYQLSVPVFLVALLPLALGILIGGFIAWIGALSARRRARRLEGRLAASQAELRQVQERQQAAREAALRASETARLSAAGQSAALVVARERPVPAHGVRTAEVR